MSVRQHSRLVRVLKRSLWLVVALVVVLLIWIASGATGVSGARIVFSSGSLAGKALQAMQSMMQNPNYQGVDAKNRPYTVSADRAIQIDKQNVALENIRADIALENDRWVALNAGSGTLNLTTKQLELTGGVSVFYDEGYEFRTQTVHIDIEQGSAFGEDLVEGQGPLGTIKSQGFALLDHGKMIIFNQSVTLKLYR